MVQITYHGLYKLNLLECLTSYQRFIPNSGQNEFIPELVKYERDRLTHDD